MGLGDARREVQADAPSGTSRQVRGLYEQAVDMTKHRRTWKKWITRSMIAIAVLALLAVAAAQVLKGSVLRQLDNGKLEAADYWTDRPEILSGGYGFDNIIGLPDLTEETVKDAGGSWYGTVKCGNGEEPTASMHTSAGLADKIPLEYKGYAEYDDGLPVVFSWPVATETMDPTDFRFTLNTGKTVFGHAAGMNPNWEDNERNTVVLFGDFGNRKSSDDPDAIFPVKLEIVDDGTPLTLVGPHGREVSAVGLRWTTTTSPYDSGPTLVGAKLNSAGTHAKGEGGDTLLEHEGTMPNDEFALVRRRGTVPAPRPHERWVLPRRRHGAPARRLRPVLPAARAR